VLYLSIVLLLCSANNSSTSSARDPLKQDFARGTLEQIELENRLEEQRSLVEDLRVEIHNKEGIPKQRLNIKYNGICF